MVFQVSLKRDLEFLEMLSVLKTFSQKSLRVGEGATVSSSGQSRLLQLQRSDNAFQVKTFFSKFCL